MIRMGISVFGIERVKFVQHPENLDETYEELIFKTP